MRDSGFMSNLRIVSNISPNTGLLYEFCINADRIDEGLITSYPVDKVAKFLTNLYNFISYKEFKEKYKSSLSKFATKTTKHGIVSVYKNKNNQEIITFIVPDYHEQFTKELIETKLSLIGYIFVNSVFYRYEPINDERWVRLVYEKRYNEKIALDKNHYRYFYHICTQEQYNNIQKRGLKPKVSQMFGINHDERLYFSTMNDMSSIYSIAQNIAINKRKPIGTTYIMLQIDLSRCSNVDFYYDPRMDNAIYTYEPIPKDAISVVDKMSI